MATSLIPKATPVANRLRKGTRALQGVDTSLVAPSVLNDTPLQQYLAVIGKGHAMESPTSQAFRSEIQSQINLKDLMSNSQKMSPSGSQELQTLPPPRLRAA